MSSGIPSFGSIHSVHEYSNDDITPTTKASRMRRSSSTEEVHRLRSNSPYFEKVSSPVENILFREAAERPHQVIKKVGKFGFQHVVGIFGGYG